MPEEVPEMPGACATMPEEVRQEEPEETVTEEPEETGSDPRSQREPEGPAVHFIDAPMTILMIGIMTILYVIFRLLSPVRTTTGTGEERMITFMIDFFLCSLRRGSAFV